MRTRLSATVFVVAAIMLVGAMGAWACTNLATLNLSESAVQPGGDIDVTGSSFQTAGSRYASVSPVDVHWDAVDGPILATVPTDETGNIATQVTVPADAQPGYHVLVATQSTTSKDGEVSAAYGSPARASVLIGASPAEDAAAQAAAPAAVTADTSSSGLVALTALLAVLGIGLFGAGLGLFVREVRRRAVPAPVREQ